MNNVIFYSSNCPRCVILETKLKQKNIKYLVKNSEDDLQKLFEEGFREMPVLEVDNTKYTFGEAVRLVNNYIE